MNHYRQMLDFRKDTSSHARIAEEAERQRVEARRRLEEQRNQK